MSSSVHSVQFYLSDYFVRSTYKRRFIFLCPKTNNTSSNDIHSTTPRVISFITEKKHIIPINNTISAIPQNLRNNIHHTLLQNVIFSRNTQTNAFQHRHLKNIETCLSDLQKSIKKIHTPVAGDPPVVEVMLIMTIVPSGTRKFGGKST